MIIAPNSKHYVYFAVCGNFVKVGYATDVLRRISNLQVGNPRTIALVMAVGHASRKAALAAESEWRLRLAACGKCARGEWVELFPEQHEDKPQFVTVDREYGAEELLRGLLSYHHGLQANIQQAAQQ